MHAYHFLNFDLLEWAEPTRSRLHVQRAGDPVLLALHFVLAVYDWRELLIRNVLEGFGAADIACVRVDEQKRFDF